MCGTSWRNKKLILIRNLKKKYHKDGHLKMKEDLSEDEL
jgi:hypothetical protein